MPIVLELNQIDKTYHDANTRQQICRQLNLQVEAGECIALFGKSGSGKSTLLNLISGIDLPDRGQITIHNHQLHQCNDEERTLFRRRHVGFVFQFFNLITALTVLENIQLPLRLNHEPSNDYADYLLQKTGLQDKIKQYPDTLSGGEQQRLALARALVHKPSLLLADEPTGNLDQETGQQILTLIAELIKQTSMTTLIVSHSQDVIQIADRILTLSDGQLVAS